MSHQKHARVRRFLALAGCAGATWTAMAPAFGADVMNGRTLYGMHCASCHGATGVSVMPMAPNFARNERLFQPDNILVTAIRNGRNAMPAYAGILTDREMFDVVAYLRAMRP